MKHNEICRHCLRWEGHYKEYKARCSQLNIQTQFDNFCRLFIHDTLKNRELENKNK